jgi:phosphoglycolate phosphatase-like HAD superfamily hydrolase
MKQLLIWDIDGTLMDCQGVGRQALNITLQSLYGIAEGFKTINFSGTIDRQIIEAAKALHALSSFDEEHFWKQYRSILRTEIQKNPQIKMLGGVQSLLETLQKQTDLYQIISTGNAKAGAWVKLEETRLAAYFQHGVFGDEADDRSALVALAIQKGQTLFDTTFESHEIFVIGDTPLDIQAAHQNGVRSIGVATGHYTTQALEVYKPEFLFDDFMDEGAFLMVLGR